jgi:hypothetical protein
MTTRRSPASTGRAIAKALQKGLGTRINPIRRQRRNNDAELMV